MIRTLSIKKGVATIVQGTIVQGDSCPRDFCPMTQLSKETIVQWDFCPRKLLPVKSLLKLIFLIFYWKLPHSLIIEYKKNTSLAAPGALAHRLQRRTACNTSPPNLSKMADGAWKYVKPYVIEPSDQLLLNKFFDPSTPSMRT